MMSLGVWDGNINSSIVLTCYLKIDSLVNSISEDINDIGFSTNDPIFDNYIVRLC